MHLTRLGVFHGGDHVGGYRTRFRVRHQTFGAKYLTELTHYRHGVGRGNNHVEVNFAGLHFLGQVFVTYDVGSSFLGFVGIFTLGEHRDAHGATRAIGHNGRTANLLIGFTRIYAEIYRDFHRFGELYAGQIFKQLQRFA